MRSSKDEILDTDKKAYILWSGVHEAYIYQIEQYNVHYARMHPDDFVKLPERTQKLLKNQWNSKVHTAITKFVGICATNPPTSGQLKEDKQMNLYWLSMKRVYAERSFDIYF